MTELRTRMDNDMLVRGMAERTRETYLAAVARLARHYHRSPDQLSAAEVQAYLVHMLREEHLAWSTCNIAVQAFRFLSRTTLGRPDSAFTIPGPRRRKTLPEILSPAEVRRLLEASTTRKQRVLLATTYAAGLRVSEVVRLRLQDIDAERMSLRVEQGKGGKDRYTLLSPRLLEELRAYWREYRPPQWLFAARGAQRPLDVSTAQKFYYAAKGRAGITKQGGIHALRHAFATHLLEAGPTSIRSSGSWATGTSAPPCAISTWPARPSWRRPRRWSGWIRRPPRRRLRCSAWPRRLRGAGSNSPSLSAPMGRRIGRPIG